MLHVVISFPDLDSLDTQRKIAIAVAKRHGLIGGLMVYHPFRQDEEREYVLDGYVHFHLVVLVNGDVPEGGSDGGVLFKVVADPERARGGKPSFHGFQELAQVRACVFYLLTHCGILPARHALTWWGAMSYNQLPTETLDANYDGRIEYCVSGGIRCPFCGSRDTEPAIVSVPHGWRSTKPVRHIWPYGVPWAGVVNDTRLV